MYKTEEYKLGTILFKKKTLTDKPFCIKDLNIPNSSKRVFHLLKHYVNSKYAAQMKPTIKAAMSYANTSRKEDAKKLTKISIYIVIKL